ncbi:MAG: hypothetical protein R3C44_08350 [Chloroflexota bacterium]
MKAQFQKQSFDETGFFAHIVGLLAIITAALYVRAILSGGFLAVAPIASSSLETGVILAVLLAIGAVALLAAWRWEWIGGLAALLCSVIVAIMAANFVERGPLFAAFIYGSPLAIAGGLYLIHAWQRRAKEATV